MDIRDILVGERSAFNFLTPYDSLLSSRTIYTVASITTLLSLVDKNLNPKENIYKLYNIEDRYDTDIKNNTYIIELTLGAKSYYVPIELINAKATIDTSVEYSERMIGIKLGFIPHAEDLSVLLSDLNMYIQLRTGMTASINEVVTSASINTTAEEHEAQELARAAVKDNKENYAKLYHDLLDDHELLMERLRALEKAYLNGIEIPTPEPDPTP